MKKIKVNKGQDSLPLQVPLKKITPKKIAVKKIVPKVEPAAEKIEPRFPGRPNDPEVQAKFGRWNVTLMAALKAKIKPQLHVWGVSRWREFMQAVGLNPFYTLDEDTAAALHYGLLFIRLYEICKRQALSKTHTPEDIEAMMSQENPKLPTVAESIRKDQAVSMKSWGYEEEFPDKETVSNLLEETKLSRISLAEPREDVVKALDSQENLRQGGTTPTPEDLKQHIENVEKIRDSSENSLKQMWAIAESVARKEPISAEETAVTENDSKFKAMVGFCKYWIKETGAVPEYPIPIVNIYWQPVKITEGSDNGNGRRGDIVSKILKFWAGVVENNGDKMSSDALASANGLIEFAPNTDIKNIAAEFDKCLRKGADEVSYRIVMAGMKIQKLVEDYASAFRLDGFPNRVPDDVMISRIKDSVVELYKAYLPIDKATLRPGPVDTLDPDYVTYRQLCHTYKLNPNQFLHEVSF